jgi:chromate transport protein ChrA
MDKKVGQAKIIFYGILSGLIAYMIIGSLCLYLLLISWADYAVHSKDKSYTFEMLLSRLFIGIIASIIAGIIATKMTNDKEKSAWFVGTIIFFIAAYNHFFMVWTDYPVWYHFAYLLPIIPITGLSHYFFCKKK